ncbi:cytosolic phospholipase A2 gamma-like [Podarcis lilfordi]|uniref:Cytosolic phospholipase A2 gamma-like n=1 Tax=Podarcis lilfordi TaxID=74358 RepID=A0AA35L5X7_9SAUR|nr:cytosolic phospholipase A2 gamma-like [Podarcis lilfordi]
MNIFPPRTQEKSEVRIIQTLTQGEQAAVASRKETVKKCLAKLGIPHDVDKTPNIAVLGSGGGLRAMIALYGTLTELKKYDLLECIMYLVGVSGSTWCMSALYKNEDWAEKVEALEKLQKETLVNGKWDLKKATEAALEASKDEHYSLTDFWSYFIVYKMLKELDERNLTEHKRSCENGKNPYPIYAAVDKHRYEGHHVGSWFEFTPHDAGAPGVGGGHSTAGYVETKLFGSLFRNGELSKKKKEKDITYLQGLWGSALASEREIKKEILGALLDLLKKDKEAYFKARELNPEYQALSFLCKAYEYILELQLSILDASAAAATGFFDLLENLLKVHSTSKSYKVLKEMRQSWTTADEKAKEEACLKLWEALHDDFGGVIKVISISPFQAIKNWIMLIHKTNVCILKWTWGSTDNFFHNDPDVKVPALKGKDVVSLIDAGLAINTAYPLILYPERNVKLILSFDFSSGDPFETITKAAEYCKVNGIKFPKIDEKDQQEKDNPLDCYIFKGEGLTIMHFPLFNRVNCPGKIDEYASTFKTFKLKYSDEEIEKLLTAAKMNVANNHQKILGEIKDIMGSPQRP